MIGSGRHPQLEAVCAEIAAVCARIGRDPKDITLVGVSKSADTTAMVAAVRAGLTDVAENRVQDAQKKFPALDGLGQPVRRHLIGHLQTNKVKAALQVCDLIQSVDSERLVMEIDKQAARLGRTADVLLQVNTAGEEQKFGVAPDGFPALLKAAQSCGHVRVLGLMTMAPFVEEEEVVRAAFRDLAGMFRQAQSDTAGHPRCNFRYLSMGMTHDYPIALEEGANMLRIGRAIFAE